MPKGPMQTTLIEATDDTGGIEWRLPAETERIISALPEEKRTLMRNAMTLMLSACAHAICEEADYSIRTGEQPMRDMLVAFSALNVLQSERSRPHAEPDKMRH